MKKILSVLIVLLMGVSALYSQGTVTVRAYACVNNKNTPGGGTVIAHAAEYSWGSSTIFGHRVYYWNLPSWKSGSTGPSSTAPSVLEQVRGDGEKRGIQYSADATSALGYYFYQWIKEDGSVLPLKNDEKNGIKDQETSYTNSTYDIKLYAIFKPVTVNIGTDAAASIEVDDLNSSSTGTVTFSVTGADNIDDFNEPTVEGDGFRYESMEYDNETITVTVRYTAQDIDNVNDGPKPSHSATVTLRSKGDTDGSNEKSAAITAEESLLPSFTLPTSLDITPNAPALTIAPATSSFYIMPSNVVAESAKTTWTATLPQTAIDKGFSVDCSATKITITFTPKNDTYEENIEVKLSVTGTYTDSQGKEIVSTQTITLSADKGHAIKINGAVNATYDFGIKVFTGQDYSSDGLTYASNINSSLTYDWDDEIFTESISGSTMTVTLPGSLKPGDYSDVLRVKSGDNELATLTTSAQVRLAQPQVEAKVYMEKILLTWKNVYGAKQYILKSGETVIDISDVMTSEAIATASTSASHTLSYSKMITEIAGVPLVTGTEYSFTLIVVYGDDPNDATKINSKTIEATTGATQEITAADLEHLDIYTGTEGDKDDYPYKKQWKVNLSSTFDASGNALFDRLYIFGMTTPASGTNITSSDPHGNTNAVTPCYMYVRDGNGYRFSASVSNVNTPTKSAMFNITADNNVKKIYATGWCPSGSNGYLPEDNGLFYIKGAAGVEVHLYVEDCYLHLRPHTESGTFDDMHKHLYQETFIPGTNPDERPSVPGVASAVVFECTSTSANSSNPFKPFVHIKGDNLFYGHRGTHFNLDISSLAGIVGMDINPILAQFCAALSVKIGPNDWGYFDYGSSTSDSHTTLTLDDKWPSSATSDEYFHTNGYLKFEKEWQASPSIDLGNKNTVLNFNGGRFELQANLPTQAQYINNLTICYRNGFVNLLGGRYVMSGTGGESTKGTVKINDGSVYVTPFNAMHEDIQEFWCLPGYFEDAVIDGTGKYAESRILRCPANTYVTGGSHPGDIRACDDQNASGHAPKDSESGHLLKKVTLKNEAEVLSNGLVNSSEFMSNTFPSNQAIECKLPDDICTNETPHDMKFSDYYSTTPYGANSIAPDADGNVHLWLPGHGKHSITYVPWEVFFPRTTLGIADFEQTLGSSNEATHDFYSDGTTVKKKLQHMLFVDVDDNILQYLKTENIGSTKLPVQVPGSTDYEYVTPTEGSEQVNHKSLANTADYTVYNSVIYVTHAIADEWMLFCPPFDVTNVYIIETANETLLSAAGNSDDGGNARETTLNVQSKYNLDAMTVIGANMVSNEKAITFWEHYSGYEKYVNKVRALKKDGKVTNGSDMDVASEYYADADGKWTGYLNNITNRTKLIHLSKTGGKFNYNDAHYYLYKQGTGNLTEWGEDSEGYFLKTNWELADATVTGVNGTTCVMKKREIYAIQLPYCPGCNDGTKWDYWTGKMLVFEGIGENTIAGKDMHATIVSDELSDGLHGNYTFANIVDANKEDDYFNGIENLYFNSTDIVNQFAVLPPAQLNPGDAFLKLPPPSSLPGRIKSINAQTGAITYEEGDDDNQGTTTGTPTISGNRQMMVYTIEGGVGIIPVTAQQVSIYNAAGQLITSQYLTEEVQIPLPAGIYLISGEKEQAKAIVR